MWVAPVGERAENNASARCPIVDDDNDDDNDADDDSPLIRSKYPSRSFLEMIIFSSRLNGSSYKCPFPLTIKILLRRIDKNHLWRIIIFECPAPLVKYSRKNFLSEKNEMSEVTAERNVFLAARKIGVKSRSSTMRKLSFTLDLFLLNDDIFLRYLPSVPLRVLKVRTLFHHFKLNSLRYPIRRYHFFFLQEIFQSESIGRVKRYKFCDR